MIITLTNSKGGVGTTSTAVTLAQWISTFGYSFIVDCDGQSDVAKSLNVSESEGTFNLFDSGAVEAFEVGTKSGGSLNVITSDRESVASLQDIIHARKRMNPNASKVLAERVRNNPELKGCNVIFDTAKSGLLREVVLCAADIVILPTGLDSKSAANTVDMINELDSLRRENAKIVILPMFMVKKRFTLQSQAINMLEEATSGRAIIYRKGIPATVALENAEWDGKTIYTSKECKGLLAAYEEFFQWLVA